MDLLNNLEAQRKLQRDEQNGWMEETKGNLFQDRLYQGTLKKDGFQAGQDSLKADSLKQDIAKLGSKVFKAETPAEQQHNRRIEEARSLTAKATAYTVESLGAVKLVKSVSHKKKEMKEVMLYRLETTRFSPAMFSGANIRAHLTEYLSLIDDYETLSGSEEAAVQERLAPLKEIMKLFTKRVRVYLENNRVSLNGEVLGEKERPAVLTEWELKRFTELTGQVNQEPEYDYLGDEQEALQGKVESLQAKLQALETDIDTLQQEIAELEEKLNTRVEDGEAERLQSLKEDLAAFRETRLLVRGQSIEAQLKLKLSGTRIMDRKDLETELKETQEDIRRLMERNLKRTLGEMVIPSSGHPGIHQITRAEALDTESDRKNIAFKEQVRQYAGRLGASLKGMEKTSPEWKPLEGAVKALKAYAEASHYKDGSEKEATLLKEALNKLTVLHDQLPGMRNTALVTEIKDYLQKMCMGSGTIPQVQDIPEEMLMDCRGRRPAETSTKRGHKRNALMHNDLVREWADMREVPIFPHEPTVNDLRQTKVSNCYMIAATTGLIGLDPRIIKNAIRDNGDGTATVRLFKSGSGKTALPVYIVVDKEVPKLRTGGDILSAGPLWMKLLEKAAAFLGRKGETGYGSLWYGEGGDWLFALTGKQKETLKNGNAYTRGYEGKNGEDALFEEIMTAKEKGIVFNCGAAKNADSALNTDHAYTVLGAKLEGGQRYVILRNPYANMSLHYDEKGASYMKHGRTLSFLSSHVGQTCGQFAIKYEDFLRNMSGITKTTIGEAFTEPQENLAEWYRELNEQVEREVQDQEEEQKRLEEVMKQDVIEDAF